MDDIKKVVFSLSGSLIADNIGQKKLDDYVDFFKEIKLEYDRVGIVTGAGPLKKWVNATENYSVPESFRDLIGIRATRLNAVLLNTLICSGSGYSPKVPKSIEQAAGLDQDLIVMGGTEPGHSTDAVAAVLAESIGASLLVKASHIDGVYDKDPDSNSDAQKYDKLSYSELREVIANESAEAGSYDLFGLSAAKIVERSEIKTVIVDGTDLQQLEGSVKGQHTGTTVL